MYCQLGQGDENVCSGVSSLRFTRRDNAEEKKFIPFPTRRHHSWGTCNVPFDGSKLILFISPVSCLSLSTSYPYKLSSRLNMRCPFSVSVTDGFWLSNRYGLERKMTGWFCESVPILWLLVPRKIEPDST